MTNGDMQLVMECIKVRVKGYIPTGEQVKDDWDRGYAAGCEDVIKYLDQIKSEWKNE